MIVVYGLLLFLLCCVFAGIEEELRRRKNDTDNHIPKVS